jgi:hypothetical protein
MSGYGGGHERDGVRGEVPDAMMTLTGSQKGKDGPKLSRLGDSRAV